MPFDLEWARRELEGGDVRLIACTAASNVTGELLANDAIAELAKEYDALYLMDAAQTAGLVPLDLHACGADIVCVAGHKGPLAPRGIGLLWASPGVAFESPSVACKIPDAGSGAKIPCGASFPSYCDLGSVNLSAAAGLVRGLEWGSQHPEASLRARQLASDFAAWVDEAPGCELLGGRDVPRTGTVAFEIAGLPLAGIEAAFAQRGVGVRVGSHCAPWALDVLGVHEGVLRVSFGHFNDEADAAALRKAVAELSPRG